MSAFKDSFVKYDWKSEYEELTDSFLKLHFGSSSGLAKTFPCMRGDYRWHTSKPTVIDSRTLAKNNTEYHGLENHAKQYHVTAQYEYAYHHWLLAASWRRDDLKANNLSDYSHENAIKYCIKHALYNKALHDWQQNPESELPTPENFGLKSNDVETKYKKAKKEIDSIKNKQT